MGVLFQTLHHTDVAKGIIDYAVKMQKPIIVNYDPDVDGLFAGYIMESYLRNHYNITPLVSINSNRGHGLLDMTCLEDSFQTVKSGDYKLVNYPKNALIVNVDSGLSDARIKELVDDGFDVVSLDHHQPEYELPENQDHPEPIKYANNGHYGILLNNQYSIEDQDYLFQSGSGVVLTYIYNTDPDYVSKDLICMNAVTLLSDSRDIDCDLARNFLEILFSCTEDNAPHLYKLAQYIGFNHYTIGKDTIDRTYVDFQLSPFVNSAMRCDLGYESIQWIMWLRKTLGASKKAQQQVINEFYTKANIREYNHLFVISVPSYESDWYTDSNFIGLFANKFLDKGKSAVIYSTRDGVFERGSFRGLYPNIDYRQAFEDMGFIALGHAGAFGLKNMKYSEEFWNLADEYIGKLEGDHEITQPIMKVDNLLKKIHEIKSVAIENQFHTNNTKTYIKYTGMNIKVESWHPKIIQYLIDEVVVTCFQVDLDEQAENTYIEPVLDKGNLKLYMKSITL